MIPSPETEHLRRRTAPSLLVERARRDPKGVAYRAKKLGLYRERTWRDYAAMVGRVATGLRRFGLQPGDRVAIMGDACEEWVLSDLGAQAAGAITYGIYPTASVTEVEYQMRDGGASIFIAENQEYVDKILPIIDRLPELRLVIVIDASAMFAYRHEKLRTFEDLVEKLDADHAVAALAEMAEALDPAAPAFIVYTSGTTGDPKGAVIAHGRHLAATFSLIDTYPTLRQPQRTVVYLPLCHVLGRDVGITLPLLGGLVPHFGEDLANLPHTMFEVQPTVLFAVPRYLQKFAGQILVGIASTSRLKRAVYDLALRYGRGHARRRWDATTGFGGNAVYWLLHAVAFRPILHKLGFSKLKLVACGGAPLSPETMALWQIYGVNTMELYGQTETAGGIISGQRGPFPRPGDVGAVPAGWQVRLGNDGEILVQCPDLFDGYWQQPALSRSVKDSEGWLRTGDIGEWSADRLRLVDRARDFIVTAGGKTISPSYIENRLRASPYVAEAIVFGHARKYLTALIEIDFDMVAEWARSRNISYTGFTSLCRDEAVFGLLKGEIEHANGDLARVEQIKDFRILPKALDPEEEGEPVTPTRKVKRKLMGERFTDLIDSMYDDEEARLVAMEAGSALHG
jgi:long-chain acyl-CoA synthetase